MSNSFLLAPAQAAVNIFHYVFLRYRVSDVTIIYGRDAYGSATSAEREIAQRVSVEPCVVPEGHIDWDDPVTKIVLRHDITPDTFVVVTGRHRYWLKPNKNDVTYYKVGVPNEED